MQLKTVRLHGGHGREDQSFLYRGYCYDAETGLYYLNSRYYDPETVRFLNADDVVNNDILGNNLFIYCSNNPINRTDSNGMLWNEIGNWFKNAISSVTNWVSSTVQSVGKWFQSTVAGTLVGSAAAQAVNNTVEHGASALKTTRYYWKPSTVVNHRNTHVKVAVPRSNATVVKSVQKVSKMGALSIGLLAVDIVRDTQTYTGNNIGLAIGVDAMAFVLSFGVGVALGATALPVAAVFALSAASGVLISSGSSWVKDNYLN